MLLKVTSDNITISEVKERKCLVGTVLGVISAHIVDSYGIPGQAPIFVTMDDTKTLAQLATDVVSYVNEVKNVTDGVITKATVLIELPGDGDAPTTATGDIEKGGLFNFNNATDSYAQGFLIPDISHLVLNGAGLIDLTNVSVTNLITFLTTAHTVITVVTKGVRALTTLRDALISFRKHRKPLSRKTKEV
jgi:hypothetical protein